MLRWTLFAASSRSFFASGLTSLSSTTFSSCAGEPRGRDGFSVPAAASMASRISSASSRRGLCRQTRRLAGSTATLAGTATALKVDLRRVRHVEYGEEAARHQRAELLRRAADADFGVADLLLVAHAEGDRAARRRVGQVQQLLFELVLLDPRSHLLRPTVG